MKNVFCLCIGLGIIFSACKSQKSVVSFSSLEGEWKITELTGITLNADDVKPSITFNVAEKRMSANAGCNAIAGIANTSGANANALKFQGVVSTRKLCLDMSKEDALVKVLEKVETFEATGSSNSPSYVFYGSGKQKLFVIGK